MFHVLTNVILSSRVCDFVLEMVMYTVCNLQAARRLNEVTILLLMVSAHDNLQSAER